MGKHTHDEKEHNKIHRTHRTPAHVLDRSPKAGGGPRCPEKSIIFDPDRAVQDGEKSADLYGGD